MFHVKHLVGVRNPKTMIRAQGIILDLDGTIYRDGRVVPGAPEAIEQLRRRAVPIVFVTNALENSDEHAAKLAKLDILASPDEIISASLVLTQHLKRLMPDATVFAIADPPLAEELGHHFQLSENPDEIDVVAVSCDRTFDYYKLNIGFQALRRGARFWAANADATCPMPDGELPDAGAVIGALEGCSGRQVELVVGKPSPLVAEAALERLGRPARECLIVGDGLETDIVMGQRAGMRTALVLTGVTRRADLVDSSVKPDYVLESIAQVPLLV